MTHIFDPGPKTYVHQLDRLNRILDLKYKDHITALDFILKSTPPIPDEYEQDVMFETPQAAAPPQEERLFTI